MLGAPVVAILEIGLPRGQEAETLRALGAFCDATRALPGCTGGGVYQSVGSSEAMYIETWRDPESLAAHIRSRDYERLLAIMETSAEHPALTFNFIGETRGLEWVEQLRIGTRPAGGSS
jgi:quinol monooxygenase YgiN